MGNIERDEIKTRVQTTMNKVIIILTFLALLGSSPLWATDLCRVDAKLVEGGLSIEVWNVAKSKILARVYGGRSNPVLYKKTPAGYIPLVPSKFGGPPPSDWAELWWSSPETANAIWSSFDVFSKTNEEIKEAFLADNLYVSLDLLVEEGDTGTFKRLTIMEKLQLVEEDKNQKEKKKGKTNEKPEARDKRNRTDPDKESP